jgi:predicted RNA-binding Zn-ribbon protein involved in translation (DUF1610 family)
MKNLFFLAVLLTTVSFTSFAQIKAGKKDTVQHALFYTCPMHPNVKSDKPGSCPKCGMDLILSKKEELKKEVTKTYTCPIHADVVSTHPGKCSKCGTKLIVDRRGSKQGTVVYTCGMHPDVVSGKPGNCPICGMGLVER